MKKKMRKAAMATVLASLVLTGPQQVLAEEDTKTEMQQPTAPAGAITDQQAIAKARALMAEGTELDQATAYFVQDGRSNDQPAWQVLLSDSKDREPGVPGDRLTVLVHAMTGDVLNFSQQKRAWMGANRPSDELARAKAVEYLQERLPDLAKRVKLSGMNGGGAAFGQGPDGKEFRWTHATVAFYEMVNGVPFYNNAIYIDVDEYGHVVGMNSNFGFDTSKLPDPAQAMKPEQAEELYAKKLQLQKQYTIGYYQETESGNYDWQAGPALVYEPTSLVEFDAITGEDVMESWRLTLQQPSRKSYAVTGVGKKLAAESKEEAKRMVVDLLGIDTSKLEYREEQRGGMPGGDPVWRFEWMEKNAGPENTRPQFVQATFDAKTGQLLFASKDAPAYAGQKQAFTVDAGEGQALELIRQYVPSGQQELFLTSARDDRQWLPTPDWYVEKKGVERYDDRRNSYSYTFTLGHQGVQVRELNYSVSLDASTGELLSLSFAHPKHLAIGLPDNAGTVSEEVAEAAYRQENPLILAYQWDRYMDQQAPSGHLVYMTDTSHMGQKYLDALTGQFVDPERETQQTK